MAMEANQYKHNPKSNSFHKPLRFSVFFLFGAGVGGAWLCIVSGNSWASFFTKVLSLLHRADSHRHYDESGLGRGPVPNQGTWMVQEQTGLAYTPQREKRALFG